MVVEGGQRGRTRTVQPALCSSVCSSCASSLSSSSSHWGWSASTCALHRCLCCLGLRAALGAHLGVHEGCGTRVLQGRWCCCWQGGNRWTAMKLGRSRGNRRRLQYGICLTRRNSWSLGRWWEEGERHSNWSNQQLISATIFSPCSEG